MHSVNFYSPFVLAIMGVFIIFIGVFLKEGVSKKISPLFSVIAIILAFFPLSFEIQASINSTEPQPILFMGSFYQILLSIVGVSSIIILASEKKSTISRFESSPLILFSLSGLLFAVFASNMIGIYLGLELASISGYIIAALNRESNKSNEGAIKYFIIGAVSSAIMIYGISLIYGFSGGNFNLHEVDYEILESNKIAITIGFLLFMCGLFFKTTTFPFHVWASDVYAGISTAPLAFLSISPKIAAFFVMFKMFAMQLAHIPFSTKLFNDVVFVLAAFSMLIGAIGALRQVNIKKIMAYSGVVHMGFIVALFSIEPKLALAGAIIYYFLVYIFINFGIFAVLMALKCNPAFDGTITSLKGLYKSNPVLSFSMAVLMFSSAGVPPLAGFFIKYSILATLIKGGSYILPIIGIIASVISSFYYLRVIKNMYFDEQDESFAKTANNKINIFLKLLILISIFVNLTFVYI